MTATPPSQTRHELKTSFGPAWVAPSAEDLPPALRQTAFAHHCKDFRYYEVLERTLPEQFKFRYFVLENTAAGETTVQPFFYVDQDIMAGLPARLQSFVTRLRRRWPRLFSLRMLMVGCAAGEGQLGSAAPWVAKALHEALDAFAPKSGASIILLKDFPSDYRESLAPFSLNGYRRVPSMPAAQLTLDFKTFESYLQDKLGKVFRKNLRRKFRSVEEAAPITMEVISDGTAIAEELHALYLQTYLRSNFRFERLTPEYFAELGRRMPDKVRYFLWRQEGRLIAFNLCMLHEGTLYDLDVGMDYRVALDLHLYFVTWRDMIQWSLANGVGVYHTGPLNYDPKLHLRMHLAPQDLYARHVWGWLNPIFKLAMAYLQPVRHDPLLKQFPNAGDL